MTFDEVFLQSQNHDCLAQVLSFLACSELASAARSAKVLHETIFGSGHEEGNVNLIWQGAEDKLTNPFDFKSTSSERRMRVGADAREHCHLFALASKAAKECEYSDNVEENRMKVDGFLADLMHVRGFDAEGIEEKKALAEHETRTIEEASAETEIRPVDIESMSDEELEARRQKAREQEERREEKWDRLKELTPPTKTCHHDVFVRISQSTTNEIISEGFCASEQKLPWFAGLELTRDYVGYSELQ